MPLEDLEVARVSGVGPLDLRDLVRQTGVVFLADLSDGFDEVVPQLRHLGKVSEQYQAVITALALRLMGRSYPFHFADGGL